MAAFQVFLYGRFWVITEAHTMRHTYRSMLDAIGTKIAVQKELMRHADIRTTMNTYGKVVTDEMAQANRKVSHSALSPSASAHPPQAHLANLIIARAKDPRHPMPATTAGALKKKAKSGTSFSLRTLAMASRIAIATANAAAMSNHPHHSKADVLVGMRAQIVLC
jgi:hypothetical protein